MLLSEILEFLNDLSPLDLQEKWDNSGLLIGSKNDEIKRVILSLDLDIELIKSSPKDALFITHHPLIFKGLTSLDFDKYPSNLIREMILRNQKLISMHTNFDKTHLNRYVFEEILGFQIDKEKDFILETDREFTLNELTQIVKEAFGLNYIRVVNPKEKIKGVALTTGAGASLIDSISSEAFLTGDIKYHDAIKAKEQDIILIDIGHYESEKFFVNVMGNLLKPLPISVIISQSQNPFEKISLKD